MTRERVTGEGDFRASPATIDPYKRLAAAVLLQALCDLRDKRDPINRMDAFLWLASDEANTFCDVLDMPDVWPKVASGKYHVKSWVRSGWRPGNKKVKRQETEV